MTETLHSLPQIEGSHLLTHSREACFKTCPRKHLWQYGIGIRPAHGSDPLRMGSAFHYGLEALKAGQSEDEAAAHAMYQEAECPPWLTPEEFAVERWTVAGMVRGYARRYAGDLIVEYVAVEQSFSLPIRNPVTGRETPSFRSGGKIDGICKLPDGRLAIMEHKTAGEDLAPDSDYWRRLLMDSQISRYYLAARELGYEVQTTIYDVTRKPLIRPKAVAKADRAWATSQGNYLGLPLTETCPERETPEMYSARLVKDMADRPEWYFARMEIPRLEADLDEFRMEQWTIQRAIRQAELEYRTVGRAAFPRNTGACTSPYRCPYIEICRGMTGDPTEEIPAGFRRVERLHEELA
jgi:hypothetical protein